MTGKQRMLKTLRFEPPDRPPHFETMFELEAEAFGLAFPDRSVWGRCGAEEKARLIDRCMAIYVRIVAAYGWDALAVYWPWSDPDGVAAARKTFGESILIGGIVGASTFSIEQVDGQYGWQRFAEDLMSAPQRLGEEARRLTAAAQDTIDRLAGAGADFILLVNDIAFNRGTFIAPRQVREHVLPYLGEQVQHVRDRGALPFIHTDGNISAILDDWIALGAACYQSIDPMAGMDIAEVKRRARGRLALMGNVQCSLLQDGPREAIRASAEYALRHGAPGGGYIYSSSNTIFPGLPLAHYEYMLEVYRDVIGVGTDGQPG
jgi:uroporphyrinogen decarboxylase